MKRDRIVIKVGTSTLTNELGNSNLRTMEKLAMVLSDIQNMGHEVILVSSGAIAVGANKMHMKEKPTTMRMKQAAAAVGQCTNMFLYDKFFGYYDKTVAQILLNAEDIAQEEKKENLSNTFSALLESGVIPVVNENDTISTSEIRLGDNDRLSALVSSLTNADLLILLSDIDGLYTDDPNRNPDAKFISTVTEITPSLLHMGKESSSSDVGTGGMQTKLKAAQIACKSGADMIIASGDDLTVIDRIVKGEEVGTLFEASRVADFDFEAYIHRSENE